MSKREFNESPYERGVNETFPFVFDVSAWPTGTYGSPTCVLKDNAGTDLSAWALSGSASIDGSDFTTTDFVADVMEVGQVYYLECAWTVDGKVYEAYCTIKATR